MKNWFVSSAILGSTLVSVSSAFALPKKDAPLFSQGAELFAVKGEKNETPIFRLLDDSPTERALAVAIVTALNQSPDTQPKLPVNQYIEVKVEKLSFQPVKKDPTKLEVSARLSGHDVDVPNTISRAEFLAGKPIEMNFPTTEKDVSMFSLRSEAKVRLHLDPKSKNLIIEDANGRLAFKSPLLGDADEKIRFSGKATRDTK